MSFTIQPEKRPETAPEQLAQFVSAVSPEYSLPEMADLFGRLARVARAVSWVDDPNSNSTQETLGWAELNHLRQEVADPSVKQMEADVITFCGRAGVEQARSLSRSLLLHKHEFISFDNDLQTLDKINIYPATDEKRQSKYRRLGGRLLGWTKSALQKLDTEPQEAAEAEPWEPATADYPASAPATALRRSAMTAMGELDPKFKWQQVLGVHELDEETCRYVLQMHSDMVGELVMAKVMGGDISRLKMPLAQRVENTRAEDLMVLFRDLTGQLKLYAGLVSIGAKLKESADV